MTEKCSQSRIDDYDMPTAERLVREGRPKAKVPCPRCGKEVSVAYYKRSGSMIPFVPSHASGDGTATRTIPQDAPQAAVVGRVRVEGPPPVRGHEWVDASARGVACRRKNDCDAWDGPGTAWAVCRRCGLCWDDAPTDRDGGCPGGSVRWPDAPPIRNAAATMEVSR